MQLQSDKETLAVCAAVGWSTKPLCILLTTATKVQSTAYRILHVQKIRMCTYLLYVYRVSQGGTKIGDTVCFLERELSAWGQHWEADLEAFHCIHLIHLNLVLGVYDLFHEIQESIATLSSPNLMPGLMESF